ncbi:RRM Nup35-type domain-containing protein [[Candida] zeylanoides]
MFGGTQSSSLFASQQKPGGGLFSSPQPNNQTSNSSAFVGAQGASNSNINNNNAVNANGTSGYIVGAPYNAASNSSVALGNPGGVQHTNNPSWFQNTKKRVIPNHLVPKKKPGFSISAPASSGSGGALASKRDLKSATHQTTRTNPFNMISFGTNSAGSAANTSGFRHASASVGSLHDAFMSGDATKYDDTVNETISDDYVLFNPSEDLPPSRSLYDLNDDVLQSLNAPSNLLSDSSLSKDPKMFNNVFSGSKPEVPTMQDRTSADSPDDPRSGREAAVLVFGYPEKMANQVIQHFQTYGNVLEEFEATKSRRQFAQYIDNTSTNPNRIAPLFTGNSWVKLTYDDANAAANALNENGTVFNGVLLGVIPYNKHAIEKLQKRTISAEEDVGGGLESLMCGQRALPKPIGSKSAVTSDSMQANRLDIKDGSGLFLHAKNAADAAKDSASQRGVTSILSSVSRYLFGINEL